MPQQGQRMDMVRDDDVGGNDGMGFNAAVTGEFIRNQSRRGVSWLVAGQWVKRLCLVLSYLVTTATDNNRRGLDCVLLFVRQ